MSVHGDRSWLGHFLWQKGHFPTNEQEQDRKPSRKNCAKHMNRQFKEVEAECQASLGIYPYTDTIN